MRLLAAAGLSLVLFAGTALPAAAAEAFEPTDRFFVNDFADVLSAQAEDEMYNLGKQLFARSEAQVVAVTVPSMDGEEVRDFAYELANRWGIGKEKEDTGVLLLLAMDERQVTIEVGKGLEGGIPDIKAAAFWIRMPRPNSKRAIIPAACWTPIVPWSTR